MATTLAQLIARVRMACGDRPATDVVSGAWSSTDTTTAFVLADGSRVTVDGRMDFDDATFEQVLIITKPTQITGVAQRGWDSVVAAHLTGALVRLNPRYPAFQYRQAVNASLQAIGAAFMRTQWDTTQSFTTTTRLLAVPATAQRVLEVAEVPTGITGFTPVPFDQLRPVPASLVATGKAVGLTGRNPGLGTAYVHYEDAWPTLTAAADTVDPDFPIDGEDLIVLGAQLWLEDSDVFTRTAFAEPHVRQRQFGSDVNDLRMAATASYQRFLARRSELASHRPKRDLAWMRS